VYIKMETIQIIQWSISIFFAIVVLFLATPDKK